MYPYKANTDPLNESDSPRGTRVEKSAIDGIDAVEEFPGRTPATGWSLPKGGFEGFSHNGV